VRSTGDERVALRGSRHRAELRSRAPGLLLPPPHLLLRHRRLHLPRPHRLRGWDESL
jgi:hypothetical protein